MKSTYVRALRAGVVKTINNSSAMMKVMVPILLEYACRWLDPWNEAVGTGNETLHLRLGSGRNVINIRPQTPPFTSGHSTAKKAQ